MTNNLLHGGTTNDEGFKSLSEEIFDQVFGASPDISRNGLVLAAVRAAAKASSSEILEEHAKKEKEKNDLTAELIEAGKATKESIEQETLRREQRERAEAWMSEDHTYAGQKMSAQEWLNTIAWFKNADNVAAWEDQIMADTGMSRKDAKRVGGKMKRMYDLIDLQKQGKILTADEAKELEKLSKDKDVIDGVAAQQKIQQLQQNNAALSLRNEVNLDAQSNANFEQTSATFSDNGPISNHVIDKPISVASQIDKSSNNDANEITLASNFNSQATGILAPSNINSIQVAPVTTTQINAANMFG